jgi:hypothetical protein
MADPSPATNPTQRSPSRLLRAVTVVLVIALVVFMLSGEMRSGDLPRLHVSLASVSSSDSMVGELLDQPMWGQFQGHGEGALSPEARAVRLGAMIASLELRHERRDPALAALAGEVAALLESFPSGGRAASRYRELTLASKPSDLQQAARLAERAGGWRGVRLGAWLQRARFAAASRDTGWFSASAIEAVRLATTTVSGSVEAEAAAVQLGEVARQRPPDWTTITTATEDLLRVAGAR